MNFITPEQFEQNKNKHDQIHKWRDVPLKVIYRIEKVEEISSKNGNATIVTLSDKDEKKLTAFATTCLIKGLKDFCWCETYYIKSLNLKKSNKILGQKYYAYDLVRIRDEFLTLS